MKKLLLALLFAMMAMLVSSVMADETAPVAATKQHAPYMANIDEALAKAAKENKHLLVDFYADW